MDGSSRRGHPGELRFITYLSPSIPQELFEAIVDHVRRTLGCERASLRVEARVSGPVRGVADPFSGDEADVAFMCSPSFVWLRELRPPPVELLGVAPVFEDVRASGRPVYFCDVVVSRDAPIRTFADLRGRSWAYNDVCSLSGYYSLLNRLAEVGEDESFFGRMSRSGSHLKSIESIIRGEVDAAAIDSNVLSIRLREVPDLRERLRVIESWGPYPIQPLVVRSALHPELKEGVRAGLLAVDADPRTRRALSEFGLKGFVPVTDEDYSPDLFLRRTLAGMSG
ncbi:MAG: phosphate/phosphite/phosphonate ABC transporter substrate-binding protein [Actinobacteria bacterium]|nr:phosphate/phosphite/phosphonate ABC transporter substrate-binding protein [Actinomycetota bacterium]